MSEVDPQEDYFEFLSSPEEEFTQPWPTSVHQSEEEDEPVTATSSPPSTLRSSPTRKAGTRWYCITSYDTSLVAHWTQILSDSRVKYFIFQEELCPETGRHHLQGYIELRRTLRFAALKVLLRDPTLHIEERWGERDEARDYCRKEATRIGDTIECGTWVPDGQGTRTDLASFVSAIMTGADDVSLLGSHPTQVLRHYRGISHIRTIVARARVPLTRTVSVTVLWGDSRVGKTYTAANAASVFFLPPSTSGTWFDGYNGETRLVIDEFKGNIPRGHLNRYLDGYRFDAATKGGFIPAEWTEVFITSNDDPSTWYKYNAVTWHAMYKRFYMELETHGPDHDHVEQHDHVQDGRTKNDARLLLAQATYVDRQTKWRPLIA